MLRSGVARTLTFTVDGTSAAARKLYALTSDGATALVEDDAGAVWLADIASGAARLVSAEADGTPVDMSYWFGDVSPDNTWVALFAITPDGSDHVVAFKNLTDGAWTVRDDSDLIWGSSLELANDGVGVYSTLRSPGPRRYEGIVFTFEAPAEFTPLVATPDGDPLFLDTTSGAIDADGTRVAFQSASNWLGVDGFLGGWDVFATDMEPGVNTLVSVGLDGAAPDDDSFGPDVAENAPDLIVFSSEATNLVAGDDNGQIDVFLRDLAAGATTLVSVGADGVQGDGASRDADISGDGRYVAFLSTATNLTPDDGDDDKDLFVKDMVRDQIVRVPGLPDEHRLENFALSDDGETLAVTMQDRQSGTTAITETVWTVTNPFLQNTAWRLWNPETQSHVYTIDMPERAQAIAGGWVLDGPAFLAGLPEVDSGAPVWRFLNTRTGAHFYTADETEKQWVEDTLPDYRLEGVAFLAHTASTDDATTPVYRFWSAERQAHFYTASEDERDYMLDAYGETYMLEGSAFWTEV